MLTERSLSQNERKRLVGFLLQHSGRRATIAPGRPVELTPVVIDDVVPWTYPPVCDFQYGEWLRREFVDGLHRSGVQVSRMKASDLRFLFARS